MTTRSIAQVQIRVSASIAGDGAGEVTRYVAIFIPDVLVEFPGLPGSHHFERGHVAYPAPFETSADTDEGKLADALEAVARALRNRKPEAGHGE